MMLLWTFFSLGWLISVVEVSYYLIKVEILWASVKDMRFLAPYSSSSKSSWKLLTLDINGDENISDFKRVATEEDWFHNLLIDSSIFCSGLRSRGWSSSITKCFEYLISCWYYWERRRFVIRSTFLRVLTILTISKSSSTFAHPISYTLSLEEAFLQHKNRRCNFKISARVKLNGAKDFI